MSFESGFPSNKPSVETDGSNKITDRIREIKENIPANHRQEVINDLKEFKCIRVLQNYKEPKDPSGLPLEVREMMEERGLGSHDYLVSASNEWVENFQPYFDILDSYEGWTPDELDKLIEGLEQ
ncbi:MAG: hypothetical protein WCK01_03375 [Candidatus Uhrbacteria bacterium]